jgi:predicted Fe-S protein YdhL (DUF1289 family)
MKSPFAPDDDALREAAAAGHPVPSPCISVCQIDPQTKLCNGCLRTINEIAAWGGMNNDARLSVWGEIRRRQSGAS